MTQPRMTCAICGRIEIVKADGRGFPPNIARRRLVEACHVYGCTCDPRYSVGFSLSGPVTGQDESEQ